MTTQFEDFVALVERLRRECPWDREQTHESLRETLVEEAYEAVDAIDRQDFVELKKELGDVLLNVVFHAVLADESGEFSIEDVLTSETDKLVSRHPHVFGDTVVDGQEEVLQNWEQIKRNESGRKSVLDGIPPALPALQFANRVQSKAARVGFDFDSASDAWSKVAEEVDELKSIPHDDQGAFEDELGDVLFAIVNYARLRGHSAEGALRRTNAKFVRRFAHIEHSLDAAGSSPGEATLEEMDRLWDEAKGLEDD